jgi:SAM-dependent methyltransferase
VLDAGCGAGMPTAKAAARGAAVTGIDASAGMLEVARRRVPAGRFDVGDLEELPYADGAFDVVMAINSVFYCSDVGRATRELARVTRSGGRVAITAWGKPEECQMAPLFAALLATLPVKPTGGGPFALSEPGALERLLEGAGLRPTAHASSRCVHVTASIDDCWRGMSAAGPVQGAIAAAGVEKVEAAVRSTLGALASRDGSVELTNTFVWAIGEKR